MKLTRIREVRQKKGLQIKEIADMLGAPYRTIQDWDSGARKPPEWIEKIVIEKIKKYKKKS